MPFVSEKTTERLKSFRTSRLDYTGCKLPVNLKVDKETNIYRTRYLHTWSQLFQNIPNC